MGKISRIEIKKNIKKANEIHHKLFVKTHKNDEKLFVFNNDFSKSTETLPPLSPNYKEDRRELRDKFHEIKLLSKEILYNSIAQAILKIIDTPYIALKIFLFIFVLISTACSSFLVVQSFFAYFAYEVATTTRTLSETPAPFPKITVCNYNPFTTMESVDFLREVNLKTRPDIDMFNETQLNMLGYREKKDFLYGIYSSAVSYILSNNVSDWTKKSLGHSLDDILISCYFNGYECTADDFVWKYDRWFGNCYVFNSGFNRTGSPIPLKNSDIAGSVFGLQMQFYIGFNSNLTQFISAFGKGAYVKVENSSYVEDENLDNGVNILPGTWVYALVDRSFEFILPKPYSNCDLDNGDQDPTQKFKSNLLNVIYHSDYQYTQQLCVYQCLQDKIIQACDCASPDYLNLFNKSSCLNDTQRDCSYKELNDFFQQNYIKEKCLHLCPLECNRTKYSKTTSEIELMGETARDYINENENLSSDFDITPIDATMAKQSIAQISVFYYSLTYISSYETPKMDIVSLLASIGGNLSLFMGVSFFSICELAELFIESYFIMKRNKIQDQHQVK